MYFQYYDICGEARGTGEGTAELQKCEGSKYTEWKSCWQEYNIARKMFKDLDQIRLEFLEM